MKKYLNKINVSFEFVILNYLAMGLGIVNTYLRPQLFSNYFNEPSFALLTLIFGLSVYLTFLDGGISKPLYSELRERYISGSLDYEKLIHQSYSFYSIVFYIVLAVFSITILLLFYLLENNLTTLLVLLISLNLVLNFSILNIKNVLIAINKYEFYQRIEILRRASVFISIVSLFFDNTFVLGNILANILLFYLLFKIKLVPEFSKSKIRLDSAISIYKSLFPKAKNFFLFTINETLIYNSGFIIIPFFYKDFQIIQYGLLIAIYNGIAMVARSIVDISIHDMTKRFINREKKESFLNFKISLLISSIISLGLFLIIFVFSKQIFEVWVGSKYEFSKIMFVGLFVLLFGNVIQHVSGTLLLSVQNNYNFMSKISTILTVIIIILQLICSYLSVQLDYFFLTTSIIYFFGSLFYVKRSLNLFSTL